MGEYQTIALDLGDRPVARVTLNRPDKRNPIGPQTCGELVDALEVVKAAQQVRVVVITGAGDVFSAGGDLSALAGRGAAAEMTASFVDVFTKLHGLGKPTIAMVNGHALAGGLGLMVACDLVIANDAATFGTTEIKVGLWPMMITAELVRNIGRKKALELMLTGRRVCAKEALELGLITEAVPHSELVNRTSEVVAGLVSQSPAAMELGLRAFYGSQDMEYTAALRFLEGELGKVLALEDAMEGISAFLQKRPPAWKGR